MDFYDWSAEERGAVYDRAEEETGASWYDLSGEERAAYIESEERRKCD